MKEMVIIACWYSCLSGSIAWKAPDGQLRYDQLCFLTSHNAFANVHERWNIYYQQVLSIQDQLKNGGQSAYA